MRRSAIAWMLAALLACNKRPEAVDRLSVPDHTTSSHCDETSVRQEVRAFLRENIPGSRLTIMPVACTSDMVEITDQFTVPSSWGSGAAQKRRAWMEAELQRLEDLRLPRRERCSGIIGTLWRAGRFLQESTRPVKELNLNSDLREASPELRMNFEKSIPSPEEFVARVKEEHLLPDLHGIRVFVYGVHNETSPESRRWTSKQATALLAAWTALLKAAGVEHIEFRASSRLEQGAGEKVSLGGLR